jgi:hypothetical protein
MIKEQNNLIFLSKGRILLIGDKCYSCKENSTFEELESNFPEIL